MQGRSLLLPVTSWSGGRGNTSSYSSSWVQVDLEPSSKEILFTFYPKMDTFHKPQVRWSMDKFGTNEPPSTVYRLLATSNKIMYALGSSDTGLVMSMFPQNITSVYPFAIRPSPVAITTVHTPGLGLGCALETPSTRMMADQGTIYLTCFPSRKNATDMKSYKVCKFNGTSFQKLPPIPLDIVSIDSPNTPFLIPVPKRNPTTPASWSLVALDNGESQLYNLAGGETEDIPLQPKNFQTDRPYTLSATTITTKEDTGHGLSITKSATLGILLGVAAFGLLIAIFGIIVYPLSVSYQGDNTLASISGRFRADRCHRSRNCSNNGRIRSAGGRRGGGISTGNTGRYHHDHTNRFS
ncbi:hypothetical protein BGX33_004294 [Mortierella sp. NVP41]|nr:hypothetical protein BGX33_004294 [Mortierella sp. NVP41]